MANGKGTPSCEVCEHVAEGWQCTLHQASLPRLDDGKYLICSDFDPSYRYYEDHGIDTNVRVGQFRFATYLKPNVLYGFSYLAPDDAKPVLRFEE